MNFEECKKIMIQYINKEITSSELDIWAVKHCPNCKERVCHCNECPMWIDEKCKFGE